MTQTALAYDDIFLQHRTGEHPERPDRLGSIVAALKGDGLWDRLVHIQSGVEPDEWIGQIHTENYIRRLERACAEGDTYIDSVDSAICPDSYEVARQAVSHALAACDAIMAGKAQNGFCALRPPGHHAERDQSMGFCLFNNVAVVCNYLQKQHGLKRIVILDWDVHHGNGTQHIFESDPTVFYCSLHEHPAACYPGTGWPQETGIGDGIGYTMNLPLEPGSHDEEWLDLFRGKFMECAHEFKPDFVLVSAGFDGHRDDPLAHINLTEKAYIEMTRDLKQLAQTHCQGRLLSVLEGGYHLEALGRCVSQHVQTLMEPS